MPGRPRIAPGGLVYHALNRAVARLPLFQKDGDYAAFVQVVQEASEQSSFSRFWWPEDYTGSPRMSIAMTWWEFRNFGIALTNAAVVLGVMPQGQLLNAMEIIFREEEAATRGRKVLKGYCNYRVRQTLEERDFQFVNGGWLSWTSIAKGTADHPDPAVQSWDPPYLRMIDTPGWSAFLGVGPNTRQLIANGVRSDANATQVWVQQVFKTWAQGEDCFTSVWGDVSTKVTWNNSLHLVRDNPTSPWRAGNDCRIHHGPMAFGSAALL